VGSIPHGPTADGGAPARVAEAFRLEYGRVVAAVVRIVRDLDTAEEIVQEAFARALHHWPAGGVPERPGAWLLTTARRGALPAAPARAPRRSPTRRPSARSTRGPT